MNPGDAIAHIVTYEGSPSFVNNTMEAAALCACGTPIKTFKTARERDGVVEWRFDYVPSHPLFNGAFTANRLIHDYRSGALETADPAHPFLVCMRALRNRERILRWMIKGQTHELILNSASNQWQYEASARFALPTHMSATPYRTREIKIPCALGVFGIPILRIEGIDRDQTFVIASTGFMGRGTPPETTQLVADYMDGTLEARDPDHPFFFAYSALETIQKLKRHMNLEIANVWIEKPRSRPGRSAFLRADATAKARDQIFHHFRRGE